MNGTIVAVVSDLSIGTNQSFTGHASNNFTSPSLRFLAAFLAAFRLSAAFGFVDFRVFILNSMQFITAIVNVVEGHT